MCLLRGRRSLRRSGEVKFNIWVGSVRESESEFNDRRAVGVSSRCRFEKLKQSLLAIWYLRGLLPMGSLVTHLKFSIRGIGFLTIPFIMRLQVNRGSMKERFLLVDWVGGFLFVSSICSFLIGMTWGGSEYPWSCWRTLVPIVIGFIGIITTLIWERYGARKPFLRLELFNSSSAFSAYVGATSQGVGIWCRSEGLFYLWGFSRLHIYPLSGAHIRMTQGSERSESTP